jgi:tetratricopeptide (TPR) repeat protein
MEIPHMKNLVFAFGFLALCSCSSMLKIQTEPAGVEVFISQQDSKEKKSIGKTPVEISREELREKLGSSISPSDMLVINLESREFESEKIYVPPSSFGATGTIVQVKMTSRKEAGNASQILQRLHNTQKFAQAGQFERAHIETDKVLEVDPQFVRALSMKGSIFYLQKNYDEAVKWYEKALAVDSSFDEAVKMIAKIKQERK